MKINKKNSVIKIKIKDVEEETKSLLKTYFPELKSKAEIEPMSFCVKILYDLVKRIEKLENSKK